MALLAEVRKIFSRRPRPALEGSPASGLVSAMKQGDAGTATSSTATRSNGSGSGGGTATATATSTTTPRRSSNGTAATRGGSEGSATAAATRAAKEHAPQRDRRDGDARGDDGRSDGARGGTVVEPTSLLPTGRVGGRSRTQEELQRLVENIGDRLDAHARRSDRIVELLSDVPSSLETLPEMSRRQVHLVEAVQDHLDQISRRDERMQSAIVELCETSRHHAEMLEAIRGQLESNHEGTRQLGEAVHGLEGSLVALTRTQERSHEVFTQMSEDSRRREERFAESVQSASRWMITAVLCCCGAAVAAVATALLAIII